MTAQSYYFMPALTQDSPVIWNYDMSRLVASRLTGYVKIKVDVRTALDIADKMPLASGVQLAFMKQVANANEITLEQMRIILGWSVRKAQKVR